MKEIQNTVTDIFSADIAEDMEMDVMMGIITQVGDEIDQVAGLSDDDIDIIISEHKRSQLSENFGLFNSMNTIESINAIKENLSKMENNLDTLVEQGVDIGNFTQLKEYVNNIGRLDKDDINYAVFNNKCLENTLASLNNIKEVYIKTENSPFSKSLPFMEQHVIAGRVNNELSMNNIEDAISFIETKLEKRKASTEWLLENEDREYLYQGTDEEEDQNINPEQDAPINPESGDVYEMDPETHTVHNFYRSSYDDIMSGDLYSESGDEIYKGTEYELFSLDEATKHILRNAVKQSGGIKAVATKSIKGARMVLSNGSSSSKGDYSKVRVQLLKQIKSCKTEEDVLYYRKDINTGLAYLKKLAIIHKRVEDKKESEYTASDKNVAKKIKKGQTSKKIGEHVKWLEDVARPTLTAKLKEIKGGR